jgi:hypothetical protein
VLHILFKGLHAGEAFERSLGSNLWRTEGLESEGLEAGFEEKRAHAASLNGCLRRRK